MKSVKISLEMAQKVKEFVAITQDCPYEILLKSGKYVVDAKSILGIFSLDLSSPSRWRSIPTTAKRFWKS